MSSTKVKKCYHVWGNVPTEKKKPTPTRLKSCVHVQIKCSTAEARLDLFVSYIFIN